LLRFPPPGGRSARAVADGRPGGAGRSSRNVQGAYPERSMDGSASLVITLALVLYTIGVWAERLQGRLKPWHLAFFWAGLVCDTVGTGMMFDFAGGMTLDVHGISGLIAILLMLVHAVWATVVLLRRDEQWIVKFHRFSLFVWLIWLIPYFSPMFFAMAT
jgi:uncharacterized repeat protein (TIGR03987 family)